MQRRLRILQLTALTSAAVFGLALVGSPPADAGGRSGPSTPKVIATGLDNPRQLSFTKSGALLVAESGEGGAGGCIESPEGRVCLGATGAVTRISARGRQSRIITGLPSLADTTGNSATGPSDVAASGRTVSVLIGLGGTPEERSTLGAGGRRLGTLIQTTRNYRSFRTVADLAAWEAANNPVADVDSNPVGLRYDRGRYLVADAGGNTALRVSQRGGIRMLAEFEVRPVVPPPIPGLPNPYPMQAVPTSVATRGHDGAYYVSQLTGFPFPAGGANIYRIDPRTGAVSVYASGLTNVTDLAFKGRTLYAVQLATTGLLAVPEGALPRGSVVKVRRGGAAATDHRVVAGNLPAPYGIAIKGKYAYVTTNAVAKNIGQVVKIRL